MPRRAIVAIASTALALALLFSFKTPDDRTGIALGTADEPVGVVAGASLSPTRTAAPAATAAPGTTERPAATAAQAPPAGGTLKDGTVTGPVVTTRFGPVQVQVTIAGGRVTDVSAVELPSDHPRSEAISQYAEPILRTEAVQAQSAQIDLVSGATYTSIAYERSLQAALDQARG